MVVPIASPIVAKHQCLQVSLQTVAEEVVRAQQGPQVVTEMLVVRVRLVAANVMQVAVVVLVALVDLAEILR
jgi:hypothetical protein